MYIPSCGWRVYRTEIWECEKMLVRRGHTSILSQERTHLDPVSGEDTPLSCLRRGHTSILSQERTHLDPVSGEDTPRSCLRRGYTSILARRGHTSIPARRGTHLDPGQERTYLCQHGRVPNSIAQVL